jgi:hypothetical protein
MATSVISSRKSLEEIVNQHLSDYEAARLTVQATPALGNALLDNCPRAQEDTANIRTRSNWALTPQSLDRNLRPCTSNCPFRLEGRWGCRSNNFWIDITTKYQPRLNLPGFSINGGETRDRVNLDRTFWQSATRTVRQGSLCDPNSQVLRGLLPDGQPNCEARVRKTEVNRVPGQYCASGSVVVGIANNGAPVCEPATNQLGIQVCVQMSDRGCSSQFGAEQCTPCMSGINSRSNTGYYSDWASDANRYDPDCTRVVIRRCGTTPSPASASDVSAATEAQENSGTIANVRTISTPCTSTGTTQRVAASFCALSRVTAWTFRYHNTADTNCTVTQVANGMWELHARCHNITVNDAHPCQMVCHD